VYQGIEPSKPSSWASTSFTSSEYAIGVVVNEAMMAAEIVSYLSVAIVADRFQPVPRMGVRESLLILLRMLVLLLWPEGQ
jgi:hypothetical protein